MQSLPWFPQNTPDLPTMDVMIHSQSSTLPSHLPAQAALRKKQQAAGLRIIQLDIVRAFLEQDEEVTQPG